MNTSGSESYERRRCGKFSAAAPTTGEAAMNNELEHARADFPILSRQIRGKPLVYLDNAASMQMSRAVMKKMREQQAEFHANGHRGIHYLSERSTERMEKARETVRRFINAESAGEIIFTSGSTQSVNLAAMALEGTVIMRGNAVAATMMEHHSNFVPWQQLCRRLGGSFMAVAMSGDCELDEKSLETVLASKPALLALTCVSNVSGTVNPVRKIIRRAHERGVPVFLDCAQAMRHMRFDVRELDCDFLCFSGHKLGGPTGTGVLYGKSALLKKMRPPYYGGGMVEMVSAEETTFTSPPYCFEAGTPNVCGIIGIGAAIDYLETIGIEKISTYESRLLNYAEDELRSVPGLDIIGHPVERAGALSFNIGGFGSFDVAMLLDRLGVAVRSGHHCAQPLLRSLGLEGAVRVSPAFYNTPEEIDILKKGLLRIAAIKR